MLEGELQATIEFFGWIYSRFDPHIDAPAYQAAGVDMNVTFLMAVDAMDMTNGKCWQSLRP